MNEESLEQIKKDIKTVTDLIIQSRDTIRHAKNKDDELILAEDLIIANLTIGRHLLQCEQVYRNKLKETQTLMVNDKPISYASAENLARISEEYYIWKRCEQISGAAEESIRVLKHASSYN